MKDQFTRQWITDSAVDILSGYTSMTLRQLHYRLVAIGMTNDTNHYKRVIAAMTKARWENVVDFQDFIDRERSMSGETEFEEKDLQEEIESGISQVDSWMKYYFLNRWSNQPEYVEVWIEKKALQGVFETPCQSHDVGLAPCKGYPSLTFVYDACQRFNNASDLGKELCILYFGDYDPSGMDIPRSIKDNLERMGCCVEIDRIALNISQIEELRLPGVPAKVKDSRSRSWSGGDVVECDAIEPKMLENMCENAILKHFDEDLYEELQVKEEEEKEEYKKALKEYVDSI